MEYERRHRGRYKGEEQPFFMKEEYQPRTTTSAKITTIATTKITTITTIYISNDFLNSNVTKTEVNKAIIF